MAKGRPDIKAASNITNQVNSNFSNKDFNNNNKDLRLQDTNNNKDLHLKDTTPIKDYFNKFKHSDRGFQVWYSTCASTIHRVDTTS